mgnify:CR=1 FL=1
MKPWIRIRIFDAPAARVAATIFCAQSFTLLVRYGSQPEPTSGAAAGAVAARGQSRRQNRAAGQQAQQQQQAPPPKRKRYKLEVEIYEARPDTWCHKKGDKFAYPQDIGKICPWLLSSLHDFLIVLEKGATLPWMYEKTAYQKVVDKTDDSGTTDHRSSRKPQKQPLTFTTNGSCMAPVNKAGALLSLVLWPGMGLTQ